MKKKRSWIWNYKCGHGSNGVIMNDSVLGISAYFTWQETTGNEKQMEECFDCYCKKLEVSVTEV